MITDESLERLREKVKRQRRELEEMQRAIAAYSGPITKCPPFKTTDIDQHGNSARLWDKLAKQLKPLAANCATNKNHACNIAA